ncbi:MAG TPA: GNAT family N-acetyltransferase [Geminicoccus sp.]|nr:GNAT family N-acetyltransferase [Geminicoccus sp.]
MHPRRSPSPSSIRPAARAEIPKLSTLIAAAFAPFEGKVPAIPFGLYVENSCNIGERWDEAEVLVAVNGGRIAGTVTFYSDASREQLGLSADWSGFRTLAVHPAMRRRGLGRLLVEECIAKARRLGSPVIGIHTAAFMESACRLYEAMGFVRCPEYDLLASSLYDFDRAAGDVPVIAYRRDLTSTP